MIFRIEESTDASDGKAARREQEEQERREKEERERKERERLLEKQIQLEREKEKEREREREEERRHDEEMARLRKEREEREKEKELEEYRALKKREQQEVMNIINSVCEAPEKPEKKSVVVSGNVQIKIGFEGTEGAQKMVLLPRKSSREELMSEIKKKYKGERIPEEFIVSFEDEDGDRIEIDDTETLHMYLAGIPEGKKGKVIVSKKPEEKPDKPENPASLEPPPSSEVSNPKLGSEYDNVANLPKAELIRTMSDHNSAVYCCSFNATGDQCCSSSRDRIIKIWTTSTAKIQHSLKGHSGLVLSCDFADKGHLVASASDDRTAKIWQAAHGKKLVTLKSHTDKVYCCRFNSGSTHLATSSCDKTVRLWNVDTGKLTNTLQKHTLAVFSCAFNTEGNILATASDDKTIKIWDWRNGTEIATLEGHTSTIWSVGFSKDGSQLITGSMLNEIKIWDFNKRALVKSITAKQPVHSVSFIKNDKYFMTCGRDYAFSVWNSSDYSLQSYTVGHTNIVYHTTYHEGTDRLLSASLDSHVKLWKPAESK
eukprot:TRINITY_DN13468_c0_g1_i2.p1 TRINITY_DN13468_c0_g1~~TRINITY_DN13468_c0_g1_i2.p1  ORF type:complete len:563 (+),score=209.61 TRINITY_DN13468_c0_g1_i2:63-1691(+)